MHSISLNSCHSVLKGFFFLCCAFIRHFQADCIKFTTERRVGRLCSMCSQRKKKTFNVFSCSQYSLVRFVSPPRGMNTDVIFLKFEKDLYIIFITINDVHLFWWGDVLSFLMEFLFITKASINIDRNVLFMRSLKLVTPFLPYQKSEWKKSRNFERKNLIYCRVPPLLRDS